ncbi:hypothetical protein SLK237_08770 [Helicobacter pylori]
MEIDLKSLENTLNNGNFKEQVTSSLEGIYQICKVLNELDIFNNFIGYDSEVTRNQIQAMKNDLAGYETKNQELKAEINALANSLEAKKQELKAEINALANSLEAKKQELEERLNTQLQSASASGIQNLNKARNELKNNLVAELKKEVKDNLALELEKLKATTQSLLNTPQIQGVTKFLGVYIYGDQSYHENPSDEFMELFEFNNTRLIANKSYIVQFSMPYELTTDGIYSDKMGEMVLCLKAGSNVYPIVNSFYQNKNTAFNFSNNKFFGTYKVNCAFKTPSEKADYKIAVFTRKHKDLWVNVNFTSNMKGFETSFLNNARFSNLTTQSLTTDYDNKHVFYKHSQALIYEILE